MNRVGPASCPPVWVGQWVSHYRVYQHHLVLSRSVIPNSLQPHGLYPSVHGDSPGKNAGVGYHALLQGIFPTQGTNLGLPHCRQIHFCPRIPEWMAYTFFRATSRHRNWTGVSCTAGGFFISRTTREAQESPGGLAKPQIAGRHPQNF